MKTFSYIIIILFILFSISACQKDIDTEKPSIDSQYTDAFPLNCDTLYFGEAFEFKTHLSDNEALGSYSVAIHNNFDQHSHSTEVSNCNFDPIKEAINPLVFIEDFDIPSGQSEYYSDVTINLPLNNNLGHFDDGDYHFFISLTDKEGWSTQKGLSIKILNR